MRVERIPLAETILPIDQEAVASAAGCTTLELLTKPIEYYMDGSKMI